MMISTSAKLSRCCQLSCWVCCCLLRSWERQFLLPTKGYLGTRCE